MPIYDTVGTVSGSGAGLSVSIDADGYVVIGDGIQVRPFKTVVNESEPGVFRWTRMEKHPELGEVELEVVDVAT
jgi:hypothetical protein